VRGPVRRGGRFAISLTLITFELVAPGLSGSRPSRCGVPMRFQVEKSPFLSALQTAKGAVPGKSTLQILNNFLFTLEANTLEVAATDMDMSVRVRVEVQGQQDGKIVVNAGKLLEIVRRQDDLPLTISVDDSVFRIRAGSYDGKLSGFDPSEFPQLPEVSSERGLRISSSELQFLEEKTAFACSKDVTRIALNGLCAEHHGGKLSLVATDGHRLGLASIPHEGDDWGQGLIIPPKALSHLLRNVPADTEIGLRIDDNFICLDAGSVQVTSKLIEGPYPKYQNVIPAQFEREALVDCRRLIGVVERISATANSRTHQVKLELNSGRLIVSARSQEDGDDSQEEMGVEYGGEGAFRLGFNAAYFVEILKMCPTDRIRLRMNSPVGAVIMEPVGEGMDFFFLLMPLRLTDE